MRVLNDKDYRLIERLVSFSQRELKHAMSQYLKKRYDNVIVTKEYIVALGDIPIALVAHMDTVFKTPATQLYYDKEKNVMWSPQGMGADDRAGVFAIMKILQSGLRPSVILTTDEEIGGLGALALSRKDCPIPGLKYLIELDRRGENDCVFYDCYNPDFVSYIEAFGFQERIGSFSDISFLMSQWGICGVNLSVGYEYEHSTSEILQINYLLDTIEKVKVMLTQSEIPVFEYREIYYDGKNWWNFSAKDIYGQHCSHCRALYSEYELFPVKGADGKMKFYCPDCIVGNVEWCEYCGEAFEMTSATNKICKDCAEDHDTCTTKKLKSKLKK